MEEDKKPQPIPQYPPVYYYPDDEITLKELILKLLEFLREYQRNWLTILVLMAGTFGLVWGYNEYKGYQYETLLTYRLKEDGYFKAFNSLAPSGYQLTIDQAELTSYAKLDFTLIALLKHTVEVDDKQASIAEHLIDAYHLSGDIALDDNGYYRLARMLYAVDGKKTTGLVQYGENSLTTTANDKELVQSINRTLYNQLNEYLQTEVKNFAEGALNNLKEDLELVEQQLEAVEDRMVLANRFSENNKTQFERDFNQLVEEKITLEKNVLNLQQLVAQKRPQLTITYLTSIPAQIGSSRTKIILIGVFLGGFLAFGWVTLRKIIRDAMA